MPFTGALPAVFTVALFARAAGGGTGALDAFAGATIFFGAEALATGAGLTFTAGRGAAVAFGFAFTGLFGRAAGAAFFTAFFAFDDRVAPDLRWLAMVTSISFPIVPELRVT
jgi:hypothetical protein